MSTQASTGSGSVVLDNLVAYAEDGLFKLPTIQREFVWKERQLKSFIEALYKGYPVGMIVFWTPEDKSLVDSSVFIDSSKTLPDYSFVLDGQQRITSMLLVKHDFNITREGRTIARRRLYFNPHIEKFAFRFGTIDEEKWINVHDVATESSRYYKFVQANETPEPTKQKLKDLRKSLTSTVLPSYTIGPKINYKEVAKIFLQINSAGVKIGTVDMFFSLLASKLPKEFKGDMLKFHYRLNERFGTSLRLPIRSLAAVLGESQSNFRSARIEQAIERIAVDQPKLESSWKKTEFYINEVVKLLCNLGLTSDNYLPSENLSMNHSAQASQLCPIRLALPFTFRM